MVTTATRPAFSLPVIAQELPAALPATPAKSWNGQTVLTANDRLLALRESLPTFHREPFVLNGIENPNYDVIVEDDTDYPITTVSKAYGLMQHEIVFDRAMDGLATLGFDLHGLEAEMALTAHGERLKISVTIPGYDFDPGDGCPLILRMNLLNSVDKTTSVAVELEWLRLVCGNGMMSGIGSAGFRKAHFRGIDEEDIAEYLAVSLQSVPQDRQLMHQWLNRDVARLSRCPGWIPPLPAYGVIRPRRGCGISSATARMPNRRFTAGAKMCRCRWYPRTNAQWCRSVPSPAPSPRWPTRTMWPRRYPGWRKRTATWVPVCAASRRSRR